MDWPRYQEVVENDQDINTIRANYGALVAMCDDYFGQLLDRFDEYNLWSDTALILSTDHGFCSQSMIGGANVGCHTTKRLVIFHL